MSTRIPISKDNFDFDEGQDSIWDRMERDMERRRKEWEDEIERMRQDFFHMRPEDRNYDAMSDRLMQRLSEPRQREDITSAIETDASGRPVFRYRFDVHDYKPEEVHVKTDAHKVLVHAKHEEKGGSASVSREFSREVNLPREIDPLDLQCIMGQDGILTLEAPLPTPGYAAVREAPHPERLPPPQERPPPPHHPQQQQQHQQQQHQQQHPESKVSSVSFHTAPGPGYPDPASSAFQPQSHPQMFSPPPPAASPMSSLGGSSASSTTSTSTSKFQGGGPAPFPGGAGVATSSFQHQQQQQQNYPGYSTPPRPAATLLSSAANTWAPVYSEKDSRFKLEIDIEDFAPEDLLVKTLDKKLVISARREEKVGNRTSTKELSREYHIPDTVDPYTVKAFFVDGGMLIVEAPVRLQALASNGGFPRSGSPLTGR